MKRTALLALALTLIASPALAQQRAFYDSSGRVAGRSTTDSGGASTFYDSSGRVSGRSSTSGNTTTIYDATGRIVGRSTVTNPKR